MPPSVFGSEDGFPAIILARMRGVFQPSGRPTPRAEPAMEAGAPPSPRIIDVRVRDGWAREGGRLEEPEAEPPTAVRCFVL